VGRGDDGPVRRRSSPPADLLSGPTTVDTLRAEPARFYRDPSRRCRQSQRERRAATVWATVSVRRLRFWGFLRQRRSVHWQQSSRLLRAACSIAQNSASRRMTTRATTSFWRGRALRPAVRRHRRRRLCGYREAKLAGGPGPPGPAPHGASGVTPSRPVG